MKKVFLLFVISIVFMVSCKKTSDETMPDSQYSVDTPKARKTIKYTVPPEDRHIKGPNGEPAKKKKYYDDYYYGGK